MIMFHEVRIYTPKGNLKKVISQEQLSKRHWNAFGKGQIIRHKLKSLIARLEAETKQVNNF